MNLRRAMSPSCIVCATTVVVMGARLAEHADHECQGDVDPSAHVQLQKRASNRPEAAVFKRCGGERLGKSHPEDGR